MCNDVPHDRATLEYQYPSDCFMWRRPDRELHVQCIFQWSLEREFMYFAGKLVYLIVRASNQLAVKHFKFSVHRIFLWKLFTFFFRQERPAVCSKSQMASSFLGPESPRPLAVVTEGYQNRFLIPYYGESAKYHFGQPYDEQMFTLIHKYLELGTTDRLCYVGDMKGSFAERIAHKFCLVEPVMTVIPGHFSYVGTDSDKVLSFRIAHTGAEEYFKQLAYSKDKEKPVFDKVIIKDAIRYFENQKECYENIMNCMEKCGKLLIIHRPGNLNTLPVFSDAKQRLEENETPYMDIIKHLQDSKFDVSWELENLPITMPKRKWFSMMREKFPPQMEILSDSEITSGCRELTDGILKYEGETVEFLDRLLFISVSHSLLEDGFPTIQRHGRQPEKTFPNLKDLKLTMAVTPDIRKLLPRKKNGTSNNNKSPLCWSELVTCYTTHNTLIGILFRYQEDLSIFFKHSVLYSELFSTQVMLTL